MKSFCIIRYDTVEENANGFINAFHSTCFFLSGIRTAAGTPGQTSAEGEALFGGNIGLMFGSYTNIDISPIVGLWVLPRIAVGAGPNFRYFKDQYGSTTIYGGKVYTEITFLQDLNNLLPLGIHRGFVSPWRI
ncbi:MAG: hypothetical protein MZV63_19760 [Marinilabiliales bacterium]|nr:hypothetical protein [Marinilabiliales bacterium]